MDLYILRNFLLSLSATFFVCLFVLLMQFLWRYMDEMVGKGLEVTVLAEFFFYSALSLVPMALPLSILLASLITFGNFGERLELLAMKAAGISLFRIMSPLMVFIALLSVGTFFFSNNVIPYTQVKLWTLIYSMKQASPEVDIPEGAFYSEIPGYNIYIRQKDRHNNLLHNVMIYDVSHGFENISVNIADSARMQFTEDKKYLVLTLYSGESFENLNKQGGIGIGKNFPYRRESFEMKQTIIPFDGGFTKLSENVTNGKYVTKNLTELRVSIDSLAHQADSLRESFSQRVQNSQNGRVYEIAHRQTDEKDHVVVAMEDKSLFEQLSPKDKRVALRYAISDVATMRNELQFKQVGIEDVDYFVRRHQIELHRKFTLSFACLIFFFIGAPLGAIIRKGGLGLPVVVSVVLFIIYYMIDNSGYKFARDGIWTAFEGMWLSSAVLLPLGIFLTYKAATDSVMFHLDDYLIFVKRIFRRK